MAHRKRKTKPRNARHLSMSARWGTPRPIVDLARSVLGQIDVDPFSEPLWNRTIGARRILDGTSGLDGFADPWVPHLDHGEPEATFTSMLKQSYDFRRWEPSHGWDDATALVNAPGDLTGANVKAAWTLLLENRRRGLLNGGAVWVGFSVEQLTYLQRDARGNRQRNPLSRDLLRLMPDKRLCFERAIGEDETESAEQPGHASYIVLLPAADHDRAEEQRDVFRLLAGRLGEVF